jgi:hypothetical protein
LIVSARAEIIYYTQFYYFTNARQFTRQGEGAVIVFASKILRVFNKLSITLDAWSLQHAIVYFFDPISIQKILLHAEI